MRCAFAALTDVRELVLHLGQPAARVCVFSLQVSDPWLK
jgi:hypothetical protein